jgi:hypothetical protein
MKVVMPKYFDDQGKALPILPLVPDEEDPASKEDMKSFNIRSRPADAGSPTFKTALRILRGHETVRTIIHWRVEMEKILTGLGVADVTDKVTLVEQMLRDIMLSTFQSAVRTHAQTVREVAAVAAERAQQNVAGTTAAQILAAGANVRAQPLTQHYQDRTLENGFRAIVTHVCPAKALQKVKRYLRREQRKPANMKVRQYYNHLVRINEQELPMLPPFRADQELADDEIIDILLYATPKSWQQELDRQEKDPMTMNIGTLLNALEAIETAENFNPEQKSNKNTAKKDGKDSKGKGKKKNNGNGNNGNTGKFCKLHGQGNHSTEECRTIKRQKTEANSGGGKSGSKNKKWTRKADEETKKSQKELQSFVKKVAKELHTYNKKRKADDDDSSSEEGEMHAMDRMFEGFSIEDLKMAAEGAKDDISV